MRQRMTHRDGWTLTMTRDIPDLAAWGFASPVTCRLDGLRVTMEQANEIYLSGPYRGSPSFSARHYRSLNPELVISGLELTEAEALAIGNGADPLLVLTGRTANGRVALVAVAVPYED